MGKFNVGVLRGGPSSEYDISLKTGDAILKNLSQDKYLPYDILIDKEGVWHIGGIPRSSDRILSQLDAVVIGLHGKYGEDGGVQQELDMHGIPYTGSGALASALSLSKHITKGWYSKAALKTPIATILREEEFTPARSMEIFRQFPQPSVIKPTACGSSVGVTIAHNFNDFVRGIKLALQFGPTVLIEEYIPGVEATCGVINNFRNQSEYTLPPTEIIPPEKSRFFSYDVKYSDETKEVCPGNFSDEVKHELQSMARSAHKILNLRHYSRSDFIVNPKRGVYILETNTLPGLTPQSLLPKSLLAVGCSFSDFLDHIITSALREKRIKT
jgi:D-alanine-D-alanine ligase